MTTSKVLPLLALAAVAAGAFGWLGSGGESAAPVTAAPRQLVLERGQRGRYELRSTSRIALANGEVVRQELAAELELHVLDESGELGLRLVTPRLVIDGSRDAARESALAVPVVVRLEGGRVAETRFPDGLGETTRRQLDALMRSFHCAVPPTGEPLLVVEEDGLGRYRARYAHTPSGAIERSKAAYLSGTSPGGMPCEVRVVRATATFELAIGGPWLERAVTDEHLDVRSLGNLACEIEQRIELVRHDSAGEGQPLTASAWLAGAEQAVASSRALERTDRVEPAVRAATAADRRAFRELLEAFVAGGGTDMAAIHALARRLAEMPDLAGEVDGVLRRTDLPGPSGAGLCHALELGAAAPCQEVLAEVGLDPQLAPNLRFTAVAALGGVARPTEATEEALLRMRGDPDASLASAAHLALGSIGKALRSDDPARYDAVRGLLADRTEHAVGDAAVVALRAAGNTGDAAFAPAAVARLGDTDATVRAAAAEAAAALGGEGVASELDRALRAEANPKVREVLVRSLAASDPNSACEACTILVAGEADERTRGAMARVLADHVGDRPELRPVLEDLLGRETSARTIAYVAGRLYREGR